LGNPKVENIFDGMTLHQSTASLKDEVKNLLQLDPKLVDIDSFLIKDIPLVNNNDTENDVDDNSKDDDLIPVCIMWLRKPVCG
jgi:hypothetical protein